MRDYVVFLIFYILKIHSFATKSLENSLKIEGLNLP